MCAVVDDLSLVFMTSKVRVQRVLMSSGVESATVIRGGEVVDCADRFLAHLTAIEKSPNTVRAYAHDLRDFVARAPRMSTMPV